MNSQLTSHIAEPIAHNAERIAHSSQLTADVDILILCGGMGTRLRPVVADRPKPMAVIDQRPFLDILIDRFRKARLRRFILCTGHLSEAIESHYAGRRDGIELVISREAQPLGTAGAVKLAEPHIQTDPFLVANGDSYCEVDLDAFIRFHQARKAALSLVVARCQDPRDYGTVKVGASQRITGFAEKSDAGPGGLISAGIYLFGRPVLSRIPASVKSSLECDIFPSLLAQPCFAFSGTSPVLDIGTPTRLSQARQVLGRK
jgi:D-glycero-alpha-D-manno-heptose 1-phosphate guanylyltransferase